MMNSYKWLKENGGVVQTVAFSSYVNIEKDKKYKDELVKVIEVLAEEQKVELVARSEIRELKGTAQEEAIATYMRLSKEAKSQMGSSAEPVNVADFVNHIDYLVQKTGIDHVGISSDFDGGGGIEGWSDASETLNVTVELVKRGYTEAQIAQLWGGNLLRVLDKVAEVAKNMQAQEM